MGWTFGGMAVKKDYTDAIENLLNALALKKAATGTAFNFSTATTKQNKGTAAGVVKGHTLLVDHLLPYDCSWEENDESGFDKKLTAYSTAAPVLVFMLDSASGTYAFSLFAGGECKRKWAAEPGNILCNEGEPLEEEIPFITGSQNGSEARVLAVFGAFVGVPFNQLLKDENTRYRVFL